MSNQSENTFLQKNYEYYQEWHRWLGKAVKLKRASLILYRADLPDLRRYEKAHQKAVKEIGEEGVAPIRHLHPDLLPAFSMFGLGTREPFQGLDGQQEPRPD
jgi:hypothetical protein